MPGFLRINAATLLAFSSSMVRGEEAVMFWLARTQIRLCDAVASTIRSCGTVNALQRASPHPRSQYTAKLPGILVLQRDLYRGLLARACFCTSQGALSCVSQHMGRAVVTQHKSSFRIRLTSINFGSRGETDIWL